jgi:hypothetical protein
MKLTKQPGKFLLAIWLILTGLTPLLHLSFLSMGTLKAFLAIAAGTLIALDQ